MAGIEKSMAQYVQEHPKLKFIFFGGKGGVGKTVMAGVTALWFAQQGRRTMLASTNPVHSLSGLLDQNVFGQETAGHGCAEPVGVGDRYQGYDRALQGGYQEQDSMVPEIRRNLHAGRRVCRIGDDESGVRRIGDVREHGRPDVQERVRRLRLRHRADGERAPPARHEQGVLAVGQQDAQVAR